MMLTSKGVCIWFTGRSGAGKSTITGALLPLLAESDRTVSVLDVVPLLKKRWCERTSEGKLLRKAFVASEIVKHGGVAICVTVSARGETRMAAREIIGPESFVEVLVEVPAEVALARKSRRKRKPSLFKRTRHALRRTAGQLPFRSQGGYDDSTAPDLVIDTMQQSAEEGARAIYRLLIDRGYVAPAAGEHGRSSAGSNQAGAVAVGPAADHSSLEEAIAGNGRSGQAND
jgi:sulfate adenylyltransferase